jgi:AcrR family transcriptional regulator
MARTTGSHAGITGPKLRQTALRLFAQHGYAAVSMRQIAQDVGVQAGALYNYTPDKQSLLFELMESHLQELLDRFEDRLGASPDDRLRHFVAFHLRFHHDRPDAVFIAYMELRNLTSENFARIEALRRRYEMLLETILCDGLKSGAFEVADPRVATRAIIAMLTGVTTWFRSGGLLSLAQIEEQYWQMVRKAVSA